MNCQPNKNKDILSTIIQGRSKIIAEKGYSFGYDIPVKRQRAIHPFLQRKGVILEVKRASPSKGDIAPDLDSYKTAYTYSEAGASAISCLTEENFFKGSLLDLMNVCKAVDDYEKNTGKQGPAVLRKDFLLTEEEIEIAYRAGADAVLLIARILDTDKIVSMAKKCQSLGISALVEVRKEEDIQKLKHIMESIDHRYILCGVNSRDLKDFSIDTLIPSQMLSCIKSLSTDTRVTFESGILTPHSAALAGAMGFDAILLGEAAAKNPERAKDFTNAFIRTDLNNAGRFWNDFAAIAKSKNKKPVVKICGITNEEDALLCQECGADILGFIFWDKSKRCTNKDFIKQIRPKIKCKMTGVIVDKDDKMAQQAFELVRQGYLDAIQFHTQQVPFIDESEYFDIPRYGAINLTNQNDLETLHQYVKDGQPRVLIDARSGDKIGGTGKTIDRELVLKASSISKLWLAGGISADNVQQIIDDYNPELIDLSSRLEKEPGIKDHCKIKMFFEKLRG